MRSSPPRDGNGYYVTQTTAWSSGDAYALPQDERMAAVEERWGKAPRSGNGAWAWARLTDRRQSEYKKATAAADAP